MARRRSRGRPPEGTPAARLEPAWRRIDLHIHTPGSSDYQEPRASYLDILQKAEARGLDMIAFTDHNSVAGYAAMQREIAYLELLEAGGRLHPEEARRLHDYRRLRERVLVLPGFEFTATFGFHILAIFPPETTVRKLEHLLLELNVPEEKLDRGTSEVGATTDVLRAYEVIADAGGLVIGAHVNSTHGIAMIGLGFGGQTKIAYTQDRNLHALEVTDLENTSRRATARFFNGSKPEYPRRMHCIQGSDAHRVTRDPQSPEKNLGVGDRCTEVLLPGQGAAQGPGRLRQHQRRRALRRRERQPGRTDPRRGERGGGGAADPRRGGPAGRAAAPAGRRDAGDRRQDDPGGDRVARHRDPLRARAGVLYVRQEGETRYLVGDRFGLSPLASLINHTGLVLILIGAVAGGLLGFREDGFAVPVDPASPIACIQPPADADVSGGPGRSLSSIALAQP